MSSEFTPTTSPRVTTVTLPSWLAERLFDCYYGAGPRYHEDQGPRPARTHTPETTPSDGSPAARLVDPPTIPPNMHSQPPIIEGLALGGSMVPKGAAARRP